MSISRWILISALLAASTHSPAQTCLSGLPESLRSVVEQDKWTIVQPQNLSESDLSLWNSNHPGLCPGVATGSPSAKANRYFLVALIHPDGPNSLLEQVLLVTQKKNRPIVEEAVSLRIVSTPHVVWLQKDSSLAIDDTGSGDSFVFERVSAPASQLIIQGSRIKSLLSLEAKAVASPPPQAASKSTDSHEALFTPPIH